MTSSTLTRGARDTLLARLRLEAFGLGSANLARRRVGMEVEFTPLAVDSGARVPIECSEGVASGPLLRSLARERGWMARRTANGAPRFVVPSGGVLSFEPGGQIEFSSAPEASVRETLDAIDRVVTPIFARARELGIEMDTRGIDPINPAESAQMYLDGPRYQRMADYFEAIDLAGRRMMRQTAAIHVNLDFEETPLERWAVANSLAPLLLAIFANSATYQGLPTGHRNYRALQWRKLDPSRCGIAVVPGEDPVEVYLDFALGSPAFLMGSPDDRPRPFADWIEDEDWSDADWQDHLSTLFPEVRPRGYLEIRAVDALPPEWYGAPLILLTGLLYDPEALHTVAEVLPVATTMDLLPAGRDGLRDPRWRALAEQIVDIGLMGARAVGEEYIGPAHLERAEHFFAQLTRRGLDPGDWDQSSSSMETEGS